VTQEELAIHELERQPEERHKKKNVNKPQEAEFHKAAHKCQNGAP
jgi:hypothetical protein